MPGPLPTIRLRLPCNTEEDFQQKYGSTLGTQGVFVPSLNMRPLGTDVRLILELRDGRPALTSRAVVSGHAAPGSRPGMTLQLTRVEPGGFHVELPAQPAQAPEAPAEPPVASAPPPGEPTEPPVPPVPAAAAEPRPPETPSVAQEGRKTTLPEAAAASADLGPPVPMQEGREDFTQPYPQSLADLLPQLGPLDDVPTAEARTAEEDVDLGDLGSGPPPVLAPEEGPTRAAAPPFILKPQPSVPPPEPPTTVVPQILPGATAPIRKSPPPPAQPQAGPAWGAGEADDDLKPYRTRLDRPRTPMENPPPEVPEPAPAAPGSEPPATWLWVLFGALVLACVAVLYILVQT